MSWGLGAEVHVTSATTTRPPELRLPKVLLALVCDVCCASCCEGLSPQSAPKSALGGSTLLELWSVGQNSWLLPRALEHVQRAKAGALGQLIYKPVVLLEQPGSYRSQNPGLRLFSEGRASTLLSVSKNPFLCVWCLGPKGVGRGLTGSWGPSLGIWSS